jgi:RNA polymerase sigma-70 factor (ECF subfamily)
MNAFTIESELLSGLRAGDENVCDQFVRENTRRMLSLAWRFLRNEDDAADAVQDAFLSAFRSLDRFEGASSPATWLHRIVINTCLMKLRSKSRRRTCSIHDLVPSFDDTGHHAEPVSRWSESAFDTLVSAENHDQVRECIDLLPEDYRTVLVLRDIEELDTDQTAAVLGINPGAVKTRLHRARQALRTLLDPFMSDGKEREIAPPK